MKVNSIGQIDSNAGQWLVLTDYGTEGIAVTSQHDRVEDAILALGEQSTGSEAIVLLPDLTLSVTKGDS